LFCLVAACGLLQGCSEGSIAGGNEAPVANAGADQTIELGQTAALDGTGSSDADGDTLTFQWTLMTAPSGGAASIVDETSSTASITPDAAGNWEIQLVVNDGQENSPPDNVIVQVVSQVCTNDAQCDDSSECTTDACTNGACVNTPLAEGTSCDDGMYCNGEETCDANGTCQAGALPCPGRACDEGNQSCVGCTTDDVCPLCQYCSNGACVNQAAGDDVKDDCPTDACHPGTCDGNGACSTEADGTDLHRRSHPGRRLPPVPGMFRSGHLLQPGGRLRRQGRVPRRRLLRRSRVLRRQRRLPGHRSGSLPGPGMRRGQRSLHRLPDRR
jgi:hypothetical protein